MYHARPDVAPMWGVVMNNFLANIFTSWRTSAAGFALILANAGKLLELIGSNAPMVAVLTSQEMSGFLMGIIGIFAKDSVVTGGTVQNPTPK